MAIRTVEQLKAKFEAGDYPRSSDYIDLIDTLAALPEPEEGAGSGSVTSVTAGTGLTGGTITTSGTIAVDTSVIQSRVADVSDTEIGYLNGVTSGIQTQLDGKAATSHNHTSSNVTDFTESAQDAVGNSVGTGLSYNDSTGAISVDTTTIQARVADVSDTEIGYLNGVTSAIQTQIDGKSATGHTHAASDVTDFTEAAQDAIGNAVGTGLSYNDSTGAISVDTTTIQARVADVSDTEIGYLNGVTSSIQTQLNAKATPSDITTAINNLVDGAPAALDTLNELAAAINDDSSYASTITTALGNKQDKVANVSDTEIGYLDGVTSAIQTQLDSKLSTSTASSTYAPLASPTLTGTVVLPSATSIGDVSSTEIGYLDGVTSAIQTQINTKASTGKAIAMAIVFGG